MIDEEKVFEQFVMPIDEVIEFLSKINRKEVLDEVYNTLVKAHKEHGYTFMDWVTANNLMEFTTEIIEKLLHTQQPMPYRGGDIENMFDPEEYSSWYDWEEDYDTKLFKLCEKVACEILLGRKIEE